MTVAIQEFDTKIDLLTLHRRAPEFYPFLLESVLHGTPQARYDILFAAPGSTLHLRDGVVRRDDALLPQSDFLTALEQWCGEEALPASIDLPFTGGWFLYLGYELAGEIEPRLRLMGDTALPTAFATRIPAAIIRDHVLNRVYAVAEAEHADLLPQLAADVFAANAANPSLASLPAIRAVAEDAPQRFMAGVDRIRDYIREGDVFQVNLSRAWQVCFDGAPAAADLYSQLRRANPAPFAALVRHGDTAIISSSPERLVQVRDGHISTRPIAGTRPRGRDDRADREYARTLMAHPKERAEHVMLIDLERNDLGRVCVPGTVQVDELMALESYAHVHHIVSNVSGQLRAGVTPAQIIRAVFPGGTITGCPKVRCMEIIAELEQCARGPYTGSVGYLGRDGGMDLNILIRTLWQRGEQVHLRTGAGIVMDSVPEHELHETRAKARGLLLALGVDPDVSD